MKAVVTDDQPVTKVTLHDGSHGRSKPVNPPDGGWGWAVMIASFFISMTVDGVSNIFGILYPEFLRVFGESKGKTQSVNSVMYGTILILAPSTGVLMRKYGARKVTMTGGLVSSVGIFLSSFSPNLDVMILLYGFVGGFGMSLVYSTSLVIVGMYFEKRRALATGIAVSGSGVGSLVFAPVCESLLETYGWRGTVWIMSGVVLNTVVCGLIYRPIGERETPGDLSIPDNSTVTCINTPRRNIVSKCSRAWYFLKDMFDFSLLTYPVYLLYLLSSFLYVAGYLIPFSYLPAQAMSIHLSSQESALLISIIGIATLVGRVLVGYVSDKPWANTLIMNSTMHMIGGLATCLVPYYTTFYVLSVYSAVYGAVTATFASLITINLVKLMGLQRLPSSIGILFMCTGLGSFIGSPIAGVLSDITGDYNSAFYLGGVLFGLAGLVSLPLSRMATREQNRNSDIKGCTNRGFTFEQPSNVSLKSIEQISETSA